MKEFTVKWIDISLLEPNRGQQYFIAFSNDNITSMAFMIYTDEGLWTDGDCAWTTEDLGVKYWMSMFDNPIDCNF